MNNKIQLEKVLNDPNNNNKPTSKMKNILRIKHIIVNKNGFKTKRSHIAEVGDEFTNEDFARIEKIRTFIKKTMEPSIGFSESSTSYGLKHDCERAIGEYVSNGELIYAMYLEGYRIKQAFVNNPNARFNYHYPKYKRQIINIYPDLARQYRWISD